MFKERMKDGTTRITGAGKSALDAWPIGSIYISMLTTSPAAHFGGTWSRFAQGRMLVGVNEGDEFWDYEGKTGGKRTVVAGDLPYHIHTIDHDHASVSTNSDGGHTHTTNRRVSSGGSTGHAIGAGVDAGDGVTGSAGGHTHDVNIPAFAGSSGPVGVLGANLLPPYIAVYMWQRTG